jgi:uncharacterized protein YaaQ
MTTKLILVILRGADRDALVRPLLDAGYRVTEFASIGGFLRRKNTTLMIGVPAEQVEQALALIRQTCPTSPGADEHRATVFVLDAPRSVTI